MFNREEPVLKTFAITVLVLGNELYRNLKRAVKETE
jgi:hypothetical protein